MSERIIVWLLDHGAYWSESVGDALAGPWYRLGGWCSRQWFNRQGDDVRKAIG